MRWVVAFLLAVSVAHACVMLESGMVINESVSVCSVPHVLVGVQVSGENIVVDCAGAIVQGRFAGEAFRISGRNVSVRNCHILNFETAFLVKNASQVFLLDNHLVRNRVGVSLIDVRDSVVYNRDVSLQDPMYVRKSDHNIISSVNRFIEGAFCASNYCNRNRRVIETFMAPKNDARSFAEWFAFQLTPQEQLRRWLYVSLAGG